MPQNLTRKILSSHLMEGKLETGAEIGIKIDQTLTQDATGTMAYLQFEAIGLPRVRTELSVSYVDHNMLQVDGYENSDDHRFLMTTAAKFGAHFSRAGNGICHQVHLERFGLPGKTLLGSDSHTPTGGGVGMIAVGAGGLDVAVAMGGGPFFMTCPEVIGVELKGKLRPFVSAKDIILEMLRILTTKGNVGKVVEYFGPGVKSLSVPERGTICNMGAELGVTTSLFPSDDTTRAYLSAQGRSKGFRALAADKGAAYDRVITIDLSKLDPMIAKPSSPDNVVKVKDVAGTKVDQVLVGSCVNSSYRDLMTVAHLVKGRKVSPRVSFGVTPGSRQVMRMVTRAGGLDTFVAAGARVLESACGFCIGMGQAPASSAVSVRTGNRNFKGRSGTKDDFVYLASPETAAMSALVGEIVDPREAAKKLKISPPRVAPPKRFLIDDTEILLPAKDPEKVEIARGPNIGAPPVAETVPEEISLEVGIKVGDKITTDHIMPAGARMKYRSNIPKYAEFVFENVDPGFSKDTAARKAKGLYTAIVGGESYGQGSSREHAAMCPMFLGVRVVLAKSLERIHTANLINFGVVPITFVNPSDYEQVKKGDGWKIRGLRRAVEKEFRVAIEGPSGQKIEGNLLATTPRQRAILLAGGMLNYTRQRSAQAAAKIA